MTGTQPREQRWDYFVAHAGDDATVAARLAGLLRAGGASVFVDVDELLPGDVWPHVLRRAQDMSMVTVILVQPTPPVPTTSLRSWPRRST